VREVFILHGFQTPSYQIRTKHNVIEPIQPKYKINVSTFFRDSFITVFGLSFLLPSLFLYQKFQSRGAWLWSESEICLSSRCLLVERKRNFRSREARGGWGKATSALLSLWHVQGYPSTTPLQYLLLRPIHLATCFLYIPDASLSRVHSVISHRTPKKSLSKAGAVS